MTFTLAQLIVLIVIAFLCGAVGKALAATPFPLCGRSSARPCSWLFFTCCPGGDGPGPDPLLGV